MTEKVTSEESAIERRRARRFEVNWNVVVRGKDELGSNVDEAGTVRDLSSRGAFLSIPRRLRVGMRLEVLIRMPSEPERWMSYPAEIVRIGKGGDGGRGAATKFLTARPKLQPAPRAGSWVKLAVLTESSSDESI